MDQRPYVGWLSKVDDVSISARALGKAAWTSGQEYERARIVKYLRERAYYYGLFNAADAIEKGV